MPQWKDTAIKERNSHWKQSSEIWGPPYPQPQATSDTPSIDLSQKAKAAPPREHQLFPLQPKLSGKDTSDGAKGPKGIALPRSQSVAGGWRPTMFRIEGPLRKTNLPL